ncbi:protein FAR-RED IMPAIRED RESPONSE 1-like [Lycium ferocissimum]|uniref:protein FAR-RED IMPAIRED RESPONSE 1-like n=1 Tax=Lycium ferocissimum TaxID=112874 RepID=UPI0028150399|nr:protein FAR-RED IMPAIRED RESPONSE 1-like [Lycium ferocissimum]
MQGKIQALLDKMNTILLLVEDAERETTKKKYTKRVGCQARVNAVKQTYGSWMVTKIKDNEFLYSMEMDGIGRIKSVVWVHSYCKDAYEEFMTLSASRQPTFEDAKNYKLIFKTWLKAMKKVAPKDILTDQRGQYKATKYELKSIVLDSITSEEFEQRWGDFIVKYELDESEWFSKLYSERQKWVPVYLNDHFWAGMLPTQRSEGMHAYFDGFISHRSTLKQFVQQYELALRNRNEKELNSEHKSRYTKTSCESMFSWEGKTYYMGEHFDCNCKSFESRGMVYCNILKVIADKKIEYLHERYILTRWRKDVVRHHLKNFFLGGYPHMTEDSLEV